MQSLLGNALGRAHSHLIENANRAVEVWKTILTLQNSKDARGQVRLKCSFFSFAIKCGLFPNFVSKEPRIWLRRSTTGNVKLVAVR